MIIWCNMRIIYYIFGFVDIQYWQGYQPVQDQLAHTNDQDTQMPIVPQPCPPNNMPVSAPTLVQLPYNTGMDKTFTVSVSCLHIS